MDQLHLEALLLDTLTMLKMRQLEVRDSITMSMEQKKKRPSNMIDSQLLLMKLILIIRAFWITKIITSMLLMKWETIHLLLDQIMISNPCLNSSRMLQKVILNQMMV